MAEEHFPVSSEFFRFLCLLSLFPVTVQLQTWLCGFCVCVCLLRINKLKFLKPQIYRVSPPVNDSKVLALFQHGKACPVLESPS